MGMSLPFFGGSQDRVTEFFAVPAHCGSPGLLDSSEFAECTAKKLYMHEFGE